MILQSHTGVDDIREVLHQYEYDNDNEHVIKSFFFVFVMHIKRVSTESRRVRYRFRAGAKLPY
jgi:hypothetical protein